MDNFFEWLGNIANIIGILSAIIAVIAWWKTREYSIKVNETLEVIQNYRKVEMYTEINKKIEHIKSSIREISNSSRSINIAKRYQELERVISEIIRALPTKNSDMIDKVKEVERTIRLYADRKEKLVESPQYQVLDDLDYVVSNLKGLMEELKQEV